MDAIERFRAQQNESESEEESDEESNHGSMVYKGTEEFESGTMIQYDTMIEIQEENKMSTIIVKDSKKKEPEAKGTVRIDYSDEEEENVEPDFMKLVRQSEGIPEPKPQRQAPEPKQIQRGPQPQNQPQSHVSSNHIVQTKETANAKEVHDKPSTAQKAQLPSEFKGMSVEYIEKTLKRLNVDMLAEIEVV